jgi:hypothetical protein
MSELEPVVSFLKEWKEIVGAIIGGVLGVVGATVVARDVRGREDRAAALVVLGTLLNIRGQFFAARRAVDYSEPADDVLLMRLAALAAAYPLDLNDSFLRTAERISVTHAHTAAHLAMINTRWSSVRIALHRWSLDSDHAAAHPGRELRRARGDMVMDARTIASGLQGIANDAACVIWLTNRLVLSKWRVLHLWKLTLWPSGVKKQCKDALRSGRYVADLPQD